MAGKDRGHLEDMSPTKIFKRCYAVALQISLAISADSLVNEKESVPGASLV